MSVSCVIPAYNESATIARVVRCAVLHPLINEVVVVDDGSSDATAAIAKQAGAHVLVNAHNLGKGQSMERGSAATTQPVILFLDADLLGLTAEHLTDLIQPVLEGNSDMTIAIRDRGPIMSRLNQWLGLWVAGERCLKRNLWESVPRDFKRAFMVELAINRTARHLGYRIHLELLRGLTIRRKEQKMGWRRGLWARIKMIKDMITALVQLYLI